MLVLATIGFLSGSAWAEQKAQPEQRAAAAEKADPAPPPPPPQRLAPEKAEPYKPACSAPKDQGEKDLCESIRANDLAAKNLYWVRIGTGAVLLSLIFTGWAAWAAAVAAKAATKSVEHAKADATEQATRFAAQLEIARASSNAAVDLAASAADTAKRQLRAYLTLRPIIFMAEKGVPTIQFKMENIGQTAAKNVTVRSEFLLRPWPIITPPDVSYGAVSPPISIQPKDRWDFPIRSVRSLTAEEKAVAVEGTQERIVVYVLIKYEDVFGSQHATPIGVSVSGGPAVRHILEGIPLPDGMTARFEVVSTKEDLT